MVSKSRTVDSIPEREAVVKMERLFFDLLLSEWRNQHYQKIMKGKQRKEGRGGGGMKKGRGGKEEGKERGSERTFDMALSVE